MILDDRGRLMRNLAAHFLLLTDLRAGALVGPPPIITSTTGPTPVAVASFKDGKIVKGEPSQMFTGLLPLEALLTVSRDVHSNLAEYQWYNSTNNRSDHNHDN